MKTPDIAVAVFNDHAAARDAIDQLSKAGFDPKSLSVVGQGYHTEETVVGFYNTGDRVKFWGSRGALWGGLWGLFLGGLFVTTPVVGPVVVLGYITASVVSAIESAVVVGGLSAIGAALVGLGVPKDSVIEYQEALRADSFLVMAHGSAEDVERARVLLAKGNPQSTRMYMGPVTEHDLLTEKAV
jgi:hypothetical protein